MTKPIYKNALKYVHMAGAATAITRSGRAVLHRVVINGAGGSGDLTIYDNNAASGAVVAVIDLTVIGTFDFAGLVLTTGLTVVTDQTADVTVVYE